MGWNDRLIDDPYGPTEEERQSFFDWQEYQHYCAMLDAEIEQQSAPPAPERMGLSSQTIDLAAIDIFAAPLGGILPMKEQSRAHDEDHKQEDHVQQAERRGGKNSPA